MGREETVKSFYRWFGRMCGRVRNLLFGRRKLTVQTQVQTVVEDNSPEVNQCLKSFEQISHDTMVDARAMARAEIQSKGWFKPAVYKQMVHERAQAIYDRLMNAGLQAVPVTA
jgi:hypothetical protein